MDAALRTFQSWADSGGALSAFKVCLVLLLLTPVQVLVHELGHATVGLLRTQGLVHVRVGKTPGWWQGRVGRLAFELSPVPTNGETGGTARTFAKLSPKARLVSALAGPAAEALLGLALYVPFELTSGRVHWILGLAILLCVLSIGANLVPRRAFGHRSDGLHALDALRALLTPAAPRALDGSSVEHFLREFDQTWARWFALYSNPRHSFRTKRLGQILANVVTVDDGEKNIELLFPLAYAGWCWREVERCEPARIVDDLRSAANVAGESGLTGPSLTAATAAELVSSSVQLAAACPGNDEQERAGFLARAFSSLPASIRRSEHPDDAQWRAFRYGVAVHDVEWFLRGESPMARV